MTQRRLVPSAGLRPVLLGQRVTILSIGDFCQLELLLDSGQKMVIWPEHHEFDGWSGWAVELEE